MLEDAELVFENGSAKKEASDEPRAAELYEQIGKLNIQLEWLKKKRGRERWLKRDAGSITIRSL